MRSRLNFQRKSKLKLLTQYRVVTYAFEKCFCQRFSENYMLTLDYQKVSTPAKEGYSKYFISLSYVIEIKEYRIGYLNIPSDRQFHSLQPSHTHHL